jgi:putative transposase
MKASRFSDAQKAFILKQAADGMPVADVCRKAGISQATYLNFQLEAEVRWAVADQVRRLKQLENQNANLKKALADLNLDKEMLQGVLPMTLRPVRKRKRLTPSVANGMCPSSGALAVGALRNPLSLRRFQCPTDCPKHRA